MVAGQVGEQATGNLLTEMARWGPKICHLLRVPWVRGRLEKLGMSENARGFTENELKELCISKVICEQQRDAPGAAA